MLRNVHNGLFYSKASSFSPLSSHFLQSLSNTVSFLCSEVLDIDYLHQVCFGESVIARYPAESEQLSLFTCPPWQPLLQSLGWGQIPAAPSHRVPDRRGKSVLLKRSFLEVWLCCSLVGTGRALSLSFDLGWAGVSGDGGAMGLQGPGHPTARGGESQPWLQAGAQN